MPLQIGTRTRHLAGQPEAPPQLLGLEHRLPGLALDPGQFLLGHPLRSLALGQVLNVLPPRSDLG